MKFLKRLFDIVFSTLMLILLSPVFAGIIFVLLITQGRPIFFVQNRVAGNQTAQSAEKLKNFKIYKFRTFKIGSKECASVKADRAEVTKVGAVLRKLSLDELPQLVNILKGDMSFVGPRPLIPAESEIRQMRFEAGIYSVKPGMTGLAQINGRDDLSDEEKTKYDKEYIDNMSVINDIKILFKTVFAVVSQKGTD